MSCELNGALEKPDEQDDDQDQRESASTDVHVRSFRSVFLPEHAVRLNVAFAAVLDQGA
jgi:hypothetical protein